MYKEMNHEQGIRQHPYPPTLSLSARHGGGSGTCTGIPVVNIIFGDMQMHSNLNIDQLANAKKDSLMFSTF